MSDGEKFCARIYNKPSQKLQIFALDASVVGESEERRAEYVLPAAIKGIKVQPNCSGAYELSLETAHVTAKSAEKLALPLRLIFEQGSGSRVGEGVVRGTRCHAFSTWGELGEATYFIDRQTKLPKQIVFDGTEYNFVWFEPMKE